MNETTTSRSSEPSDSTIAKPESANTETPAGDAPTKDATTPDTTPLSEAAPPVTAAPPPGASIPPGGEVAGSVPPPSAFLPPLGNEPPPADPTPPASAPSSSTTRLRRSKSNRMIAGVCGGFAEVLGVDVTILRLALVLATVLGFGAGVVLYIACWILMPEED
jgi:phage shock protein C